jgi:phage-related minor tail protein
MVVSGGTLATLAGILVALLAGGLSAFAATRSARINAAATKQAAETAAKQASFDQSLDLTKYVREEVKKAVEEETKDLREKVKALERIVDNLHGKYALMRDAFRDFFRETFAKLGSETPAIDSKIRELLNDAEEDTSTGAMVQQLRDSIRSEDEDDERTTFEP